MKNKKGAYEAAGPRVPGAPAFQWRVSRGLDSFEKILLIYIWWEGGLKGVKFFRGRWYEYEAEAQPKETLPKRAANST